MKQPVHKLRAPDDLAELIRKMHPHLKKKIKSSLQIILSDPSSGKALKALKDEHAGLRSFHVSRFRIIYRVLPKKDIEIIAIGPRERIYESAFWILNKEDDSVNK